MINNKKMFGIVPAVITPLKKNGTLDVEGLERLINHLISADVNGLFIAGYTGEGAVLPFSLVKELVRYAKKFVNGRISVCCGVIETGSDRTIETAKKLIDEGMDFLSTTIPFPPPVPTQEEIIRHYEKITSATQAKWMVYGNSGSLPNIAPETFHKLAQIDDIVAIKDTRPDYEGHIKNLIAVDNDDVSILCGGEYLIGPGLLFGADGNISGATNVFPRLFVHLYDAAKKQDVDEVNKCAKDIVALHSITQLEDACWLSAFKYACSKKGLINDYCLKPVQPISSKDKYKIDQVLDTLSSWS